MQVTKEPLDPCQVALTIEVEPDKVVQAVDRAYREYAKHVTIPGFRKGKAPLNFVRQRVPESDVRQRAAEILVEPAYEEALQTEQVEPYAQPQLELLQLDLAANGEGPKPFIFKAVVPLAPHVTLGPYAGLEVERNRYELTDEDMDAQMERMRLRAADYPKVERPVQDGDLVIADVAAEVDARPEAATPHPTMLEIGQDNIPGFDEQLVGLNIGDEKTFTLTYPEDYPEEDLAGQTAEFTVTINEVREKQVPALDDELAKKISNGKIETLDALKADLRADMEKQLLQTAESQVEASLVDQIVANSTIEYPPVLVSAEVNQDAEILMDRLQREGVSLDDYLAQTGKTREQITAEMREGAEKRIRIGLVLGEIADKENLTLTDADVEAAIAERAQAQGATPAAMRAFLEGNGQVDALRNRAQTKKVLDFLLAAAIIQDKVVRADEDTAEDVGEAAADEIEEAAFLESDGTESEG